jgi:hypothetical protein
MQQRGRGPADRNGFPGQSHRRAERALAARGPSGAFSPHGCTARQGCGEADTPGGVPARLPRIGAADPCRCIARVAP